METSIALVTGGAGFVGSHLIRRLLADEAVTSVVSLDNYFTGSTANHIADSRVTYLDASTIDIEATWQAHGLPDPHIVYHLGEYSRIVQSFDDHDLTWDFNLRGTKEVVKFASTRQARLVYAGSSSKFGNDGEDENLNPYAWTKAKNVEFIANYSHWYGLDYVITYFYNVYGPGHIKTGKYATVIGIFEHCYETGKPLPVVSPGTQTRDFTHVDDIVDGIVRCGRDGKGDGYLLGTGVESRIIDIADLFGTEVQMIPSLRGERVRGRADTTKARDLGWAPEWTIERYIANFLSGS